MGKRDKEHRKKVAKRKERLKIEERQIDSLQRKIFEEAKQRYYDNLSGKTQDTFQIKL
jgi:hypothetical protein